MVDIILLAKHTHTEGVKKQKKTNLMLLLDLQKVTEIIEVFGIRIYHLLHGKYHTISCKRCEYQQNDANNKWKYPNE